MKIEIIDGTYTRDDDATALLTRAEEEYLAALAQKLIIRQEHKKNKVLKEQEMERVRIEKQQEKERL